MNETERTRRRVVTASTRRPPTTLQAIRVVFEEDREADASYLEENEFKSRLAEYKRGEFKFVYVQAEADVVIAGIGQRLVSGGRLEIESDTEEALLDEMIAEEWESLRNVLKTVGVPTEQLPLAVKRGWIEWRT